MPLRDPARWIPEALDDFRAGKRPAGLLEGGHETVEVEVTEGMTAERVGSGDLPVLASPVLVTLVERTAVDLLRHRLPPGLTTVGGSIALTHEAPTPLGASIRLTVTLEPGDGRTLRFAFVAGDGEGEVARGSHVRVIVDRERFLASAVARRAVGHPR